jgi:hypothetical protein
MTNKPNKFIQSFFARALKNDPKTYITRQNNFCLLVTLGDPDKSSPVLFFPSVPEKCNHVS